MTKYSNLTKKYLHRIMKLNEKQRKADPKDCKRHTKFIIQYCLKNDLKSLKFNRTKNGYNTDCLFWDPLDFMSIPQRKVVEKQIEDLKK